MNKTIYIPTIMVLPFTFIFICFWPVDESVNKKLEKFYNANVISTEENMKFFNDNCILLYIAGVACQSI